MWNSDLKRQQKVIMNMINEIEILRHINKNSEHSLFESMIDRDSKNIQLSDQNQKKEKKKKKE